MFIQAIQFSDAGLNGGLKTSFSDFTLGSFDAALTSIISKSQESETCTMLFLTSVLANKAEITILWTQDTTRAWVPGRGIMGRDVRVYKTGYNTWLSSRLQNQPRSFPSFRLIFSFVQFFLLQVMHPVWWNRLF